MRHNRLVVIRENPDWVVWRGEHPFTRARVTVKQVQPRSPRADLLRSRLEREYQFLAAVQHKNIIRPTQLGNDGTALAFEDTQGSLAQLLQQEGRLPVDLVANVLLQCLDGLDHLHGQRCGHGAISPESLLLSPTGGIKLGDFTGYRFDQGAPEPGGELKYQAPELLDGTLGARARRPTCTASATWPSNSSWATSSTACSDSIRPTGPGTARTGSAGTPTRSASSARSRKRSRMSRPRCSTSSPG